MSPALRRLPVAALALVAACRCAEAPGPPEAPLRVSVGGCAGVGRDGACEPGAARRLRLWVEAAPGAAVEVRADGRPLPAVDAGLPGGHALDVVVPPSAAAVEVRARDGEAAAAWRLPLRDPAPFPALARGLAARAAGRLDEAEVAAREALAAPPPGRRGDALGLLARVHLSRGDAAAAAEGLRAAVRAHREAGRVSGEALDAVTLAYVLRRLRRDLPGARAALRDAEPAFAAWPEGRAHALYHRALVDQDAGDLASALDHLADAERLAARLGVTAVVGAVRQARPALLLVYGRRADALAALEALRESLADDAPPCERAALAANLGWARLLLRDAGRPEGGDPRPDVEAAVALYREACPRPALLANALVNRAMLDLQAGDPEAARRHLGEARAAVAEPDAVVRFWMAELEAAATLALGRAEEAAARWAELARRAEAAQEPEVAWRAHAGRGEALLEGGRADEALAAWREAEALLDARAAAVPLGEGREGFLGDRSRTAARLVDLLVAEGRPAEALDAARRARARVLRGLARAQRLAALDAPARQAWEEALAAWRRGRDALEAEMAGDWALPASRLAEVAEARRERETALVRALDAALQGPAAAARPGGEPAALREGDLLLLWYPGREGWLGFAADGQGVVAARLGPVDPGAPAEALGEQLLGPFRGALAGARRVLLAPTGPLGDVDLHALPLDGRPLLARAPVAWTLDVGDPPPGAAGEGAVVVADPREDLPAAREEGRAVAAALRAGGAAPRLLAGAQATRPAVLDALGTARHLHYAGHGVFEGAGGWRSSLPLAGDQRLTLGDLLALPRPPETAVLSGCETGRAAPAAAVEALGLAQALVTAGTRAAVAAVRPVDDADAAALAGLLYAPALAGLLDAPAPPGAAAPDPPPGGPLDLAARLRAAQLALRDTRPDADWASWRALVP